MNLIESNLPLDEAKNLPLRANQLPRFRGLYAAFVCVMHPASFLELTTSDSDELARIKAKKYPLDDEEYNNRHDWEGAAPPGRFETPFLMVHFPSGKIKGHEGRHRAAMILREGGKSFPVMIIPYEENEYALHITYRNDAGEEKTETEVFHSDADMRRRDMDLIMGSLHNSETDEFKYVTSDREKLHGDKLRGAPERSKTAWQYAAWKVEDFPKKLIGQYKDWWATDRFKVGLVKGYKHHREFDPEADQ